MWSAMALAIAFKRRQGFRTPQEGFYRVVSLAVRWRLDSAWSSF